MGKYDYATEYFTEALETHMDRTEELNDQDFQKESGLQVDTVEKVRFELHAISGGKSKCIGEMTVDVEGDER